MFEALVRGMVAALPSVMGNIGSTNKEAVAPQPAGAPQQGFNDGIDMNDPLAAFSAATISIMGNNFINSYRQNTVQKKSFWSSLGDMITGLFTTIASLFVFNTTVNAYQQPYTKTDALYDETFGYDNDSFGYDNGWASDLDQSRNEDRVYCDNYDEYSSYYFDEPVSRRSYLPSPMRLNDKFNNQCDDYLFENDNNGFDVDYNECDCRSNGIDGLFVNQPRQKQFKAQNRQRPQKQQLFNPTYANVYDNLQQPQYQQQPVQQPRPQQSFNTTYANVYDNIQQPQYQQSMNTMDEFDASLGLDNINRGEYEGWYSVPAGCRKDDNNNEAMQCESIVNEYTHDRASQNANNIDQLMESRYVACFDERLANPTPVDLMNVNEETKMRLVKTAADVNDNTVCFMSVEDYNEEMRNMRI